MLSSPFDILGALNQFTESISAFLPKNSGTIGGAIVFAVLFRLGTKALIGAPKNGGAKKVSAPDSDLPSDTSDAGKTADGDGEEEHTADQQKEAKKQKEEEQRRAQEQLKELFEMFYEESEKTEEKEEKQKTQEEKELEALGLEREDLEQLREQYKALTIEISALLEKGLTADQTAKSLISRSSEQIPVMELQPLIDAIGCFLKKNEKTEKNTAVIGMDPQFEQKAALSALKRGDYETALGFLDRQAVESIHKASSTHRSDICVPALEQAAVVYRAIGVLTRPLDPEKSFEALKKSKELAPENTVTEALIARAYYESGKTKKAVQLFENISEKGNENDYAAHYADQMIPQIRTQRTMQHAQRIREEYEHRLGDTEGRQKTDQRVSLQQRKREEVRRANTRFMVAEEIRERDNERDFL
ncbi:MAG: hypothetical protein IJ752_00440 [Alphaproteobacteria bacterium]|nr:hypothetical protein [Alphaproteobacteria bacterium]